MNETKKKKNKSDCPTYPVKQKQTPKRIYIKYSALNTKKHKENRQQQLLDMSMCCFLATSQQHSIEKWVGVGSSEYEWMTVRMDDCMHC